MMSCRAESASCASGRSEIFGIPPASETTSEFHIRLAVADRTGVLAEVAGIFAEHGISIAAVSQTYEADASLPTLTITPHATSRSSIDTALADLHNTSSVDRVIAVMNKEA